MTAAMPDMPSPLISGSVRPPCGRGERAMGVVAGRRARGFTIAELIVAIGVTLVLLIGVGRIFTMSQNTISIGSASAELTQKQRAIEALLRTDLEAIEREQGFLVLRGERIGPDAIGSNNQRPVYLNREALDEGEIMPTRRLDQIAFIANGDFATYQYRNANDRDQIARNLTSSSARVWYGHGLRDPERFDFTEHGEIKGATGLNGYRIYHADPRDVNQYNSFASDWVLARQAALLLPRTLVQDPEQLNIAPSIIEYFNEVGENYYTSRYFRTHTGVSHDVYGSYTRADPVWRLSAGIVDMVDQTPAEVEMMITDYGFAYNRLTAAWDQYNDPIGEAGNSRRSWKQDSLTPNPPLPSFLPTDQLQQLESKNLSYFWAQGQRYRMMMIPGRIRVETGTPSPRRFDQMLTHATLMSGCSDFQVAWSTGEIDPETGNVVWYDINYPANPNPNIPRERGLTRGDVLRRAPSDPTIWYISEITPYDMPTDRPVAEAQSPDLYYATFGYFLPKRRTGVDELESRSEKWPWPSMLRFRITLHDENNRIAGGRSFEFVVALPE